MMTSCAKSQSHCLNSFRSLRIWLAIGVLLSIPFDFVKKANAEELGSLMLPLIKEHRGEVGIAIKNLETGETFKYRSDAVMPTASLIKLPVLIELYRQSVTGSVSLSKMITVQESDKVPGSGILTDHFKVGTQIPLETAARLMITYSDNTATNLVLDQIGLASVAKTMVELGLPETQIHAKVFRRDTSIDPERSQKYGLGSTTADDMLNLLERIHKRELISPEACEAMLAHLATCDDDTKLRRALPKSVKAFHKTGAVSDCRTDAGLFRTPAGWLAMVVLTAKNEDHRWTEDNAAEIFCGSVGDIAYRWFNPPGTAESTEPNVLRLGSNGELVEALQRSLNSLLVPTPGLSVDGDYGPMTENAVKKFQSEKGLPATGIVDAATWKQVGPIQFTPARGETSEPTEKLPDVTEADALEGRPFVSCKSWMIAEANSGRTIDSFESDKPLEIASTTKMMSALLVARWAVDHPESLDERLEFSTRADETPGSSTTVRKGESLTVLEALYGLMLPSGNDAATALAEHFGKRLAPAEKKDQDPLQSFIDAMNQEASRLEMKQTQFRNPHGMSHPEHRSTCEDLVRLAREILKYPLLRKIIATREYRCETEGKDGYTRTLTWRNGNELLSIGGFIGIKTGTTDNAGACLVSCSIRDGKELIVVVLGSSGSAARYSDSRNLHRWGWSSLRN
jgi:D-alanyl-D-alanine carboxypeptidase (penicillin-binding protein 5/6)